MRYKEDNDNRYRVNFMRATEELMDAHRTLVKEGKLLEAREILRLLRKGHIKLGLDDVSWNVESLCEELGCKIFYSSRGYTAEVRL